MRTLQKGFHPMRISPTTEEERSEGSEECKSITCSEEDR